MMAIIQNVNNINLIAIGFVSILLLFLLSSCAGIPSEEREESPLQFFFPSVKHTNVWPDLEIAYQLTSDACQIILNYTNDDNSSHSRELELTFTDDRVQNQTLGRFSPGVHEIAARAFVSTRGYFEMSGVEYNDDGSISRRSYDDLKFYVLGGDVVLLTPDSSTFATSQFDFYMRVVSLETCEFRMADSRNTDQTALRFKVNGTARLPDTGGSYTFDYQETRKFRGCILPSADDPVWPKDLASYPLPFAVNFSLSRTILLPPSPNITIPLWSSVLPVTNTSSSLYLSAHYSAIKMDKICSGETMRAFGKFNVEKKYRCQFQSGDFLLFSAWKEPVSSGEIIFTFPNGFQYQERVSLVNVFEEHPALPNSGVRIGNSLKCTSRYPFQCYVTLGAATCAPMGVLVLRAVFGLALIGIVLMIFIPIYWFIVPRKAEDEVVVSATD